MQQFVKGQNEVKAAIPYGGIKEIANNSKTSIFTVSRVINGKSNNRKVLEEINNYLMGIKIVKDSVMNNAKSICEKLN